MPFIASKIATWTIAIFFGGFWGGCGGVLNSGKQHPAPVGDDVCGDGFSGLLDITATGFSGLLDITATEED